MTKLSVDSNKKNRSLPYVYLFCSAMKKERAEGELSLPSDPSNISRMETNMPLNPDTLIAPLTQAEPPQWHVYRALVLYLYANPEATKDLYFRHKLNAAHDAYLDTFAAG